MRAESSQGAAATENAGAADGASDKALLRGLMGCPLVGRCLRDFHQATGLHVRLLPCRCMSGERGLRTRENPFCARFHRHNGTHPPCGGGCAELLARAERTSALEEAECMAGMSNVAVPVQVGGRHVATFLAGQVFVGSNGNGRPSSARAVLCRCGLLRKEPKLESLWRQSPTVPHERMRGCVQWLVTLAALLADGAVRWMLSDHGEGEMGIVADAKQYVAGHLTQSIATGSVARHLRRSAPSFCRLFKTRTGGTFMNFLWQARVERAKEMLATSRHCVKEAAYGAGFQSLSHFRRVFRKNTGVGPQEYRVNHGPLLVNHRPPGILVEDSEGSQDVPRSRRNIHENRTRRNHRRARR